MLTVGVAVTGVPEDELKLPVGDHTKVEAPEAVNIVLPPLQNEFVPDTTIVGKAFTVTIAEPVTA